MNPNPSPDKANEMRLSHIGIAALTIAGAALGVSVGEPESIMLLPKPKPSPKPSGQPIPAGTMTRQQRRAAERRAFKDLPA